MTTVKRLGIWMDHSSAHIMEVSGDAAETKTLETDLTRAENEESLNKSESVMHNKDQQQLSDYYKRLGELILNYDEVLLFGPTDAKSELANVLKEDHHFDKIKIETEAADKMTDPQQHAFVRDHFFKKQAL